MYIVTFQDNTKFQGGTINNSRWLFIPNKPIQKIEFNLFKKIITLSDFEAYNHLIEKAVSLVGVKFTRVTQIILMGKSGKTVIRVTIDLLKRKVYAEKVEFGKEYRNKPTTGWKKGIKFSIGKIGIKSI